MRQINILGATLNMCLPIALVMPPHSSAIENAWAFLKDSAEMDRADARMDNPAWLNMLHQDPQMREQERLRLQEMANRAKDRGPMQPTMAANLEDRINEHLNILDSRGERNG